MKKLLYTLTITLIFLSLNKSALAQYVLKEADGQYRLFNYRKAIGLYEQAYSRKPTLHAAERLGACYSFLNDYSNAEKWYGIAAATPGTTNKNILAYAIALQQKAKYAEARAAYLRYAALDSTTTDRQRELWLTSCDSSVIWMKMPMDISVKNEIEMNSEFSDWGIGMYANSVIFASDRSVISADRPMTVKPFLSFDHGSRPSISRYGWTGQAYLDLYAFDSVKKSSSIFQLDRPSAYHLGPASFTKNGNEMFFTLTRIPKMRSLAEDNLATVNLEIYSAKKDSTGRWSLPKAFKYNQVLKYSVGDPHISAFGDSLYFVSDMPGGMGGTDLYISKRLDNGEWDVPVNLRDVNSAGNERTPFLYDDDTLFFSTDGRIGMGGLDIFGSEILKGKYLKPSNMGYPINSPQDDFSFFKTSSSSGFFSSDRLDGLGKDDIYSFYQQQSDLVLTGNVFDSSTRQPISGALVTLLSDAGEKLMATTDDKSGFRFVLPRDKDYQITAAKIDYMKAVDNFSTKNSSLEIKKDMYLTRASELDKSIKIENIYYNFDKSDIRATETSRLDKVVKIMKDNPNLYIELGSHTDSRGRDLYNMSLSQQRANSAVQYLINRGVERTRIVPKGYGETKLVNRCGNGAICSEEEHQANRRTEFRVFRP